VDEVSRRAAGFTFSEPQRRAVREEVTSALLPFVSNGQLQMSVEMLIGVGRAREVAR
jgi:hypothetical protein